MGNVSGNRSKGKGLLCCFGPSFSNPKLKRSRSASSVSTESEREEASSSESHVAGISPERIKLYTHLITYIKRQGNPKGAISIPNQYEATIREDVRERVPEAWAVRDMNEFDGGTQKYLRLNNMSVLEALEETLKELNDKNSLSTLVTQRIENLTTLKEILQTRQ